MKLTQELRSAATKGLAFAPTLIPDHLCWIAADQIEELLKSLKLARDQIVHLEQLYMPSNLG